MSNINEGYKLIPLDEITPEAREIAVRWVEGYESCGFDLPGKHKLASDIMNYAKQYKEKADKWDALEKKIASYYVLPYDDPEEFEGGDLLDIGEAAARAFGFM